MGFVHSTNGLLLNVVLWGLTMTGDSTTVNAYVWLKLDTAGALVEPLLGLLIARIV